MIDRPPAPVAHALSAVRGLMFGLALTALVLVAVGAQQGWFAPDDRIVSESSERDVIADLLAEHDCWTGEGPPDVIPGHAVVTFERNPTGPPQPQLVGEQGAGRALAHLFDTPDPGIRHVHGFCE